MVQVEVTIPERFKFPSTPVGPADHGSPAGWSQVGGDIFTLDAAFFLFVFCLRFL